MIAFLLALAIEGTEFRVLIGHNLPKRAIERQLKAATTFSSHTINFRLLKKGESSNLTITRDCNDPLMYDRLAYTIIEKSKSGSIIAAAIVFSCSSGATDDITIQHELGHVLGFSHREDVELGRKKIQRVREKVQ